MKINTTTKKFIEIELTLEDVKRNLKEYQVERFHELATNLNGITPKIQCELFWNLQQGEHTEWFKDTCEEHDILWIATPIGIQNWINLIVEFPHMFLDEVIDNLNDEILEVNFEGVTVDSQAILDHI